MNPGSAVGMILESPTMDHSQGPSRAHNLYRYKGDSMDCRDESASHGPSYDQRERHLFSSLFQREDSPSHINPPIIRWNRKLRIHQLPSSCSLCLIVRNISVNDERKEKDPKSLSFVCIFLFFAVSMKNISQSVGNRSYP
jgi:hypothetical protein